MSKLKQAVAIQYTEEEDAAPRVIAKGRGSVADQILRIARENDVPDYEDGELVHLLESIDLDSEIPAELFYAVAEVLVFIYELEKEM
ncbi:MAG: flagellar biosynthesis protein FlhB [Desulfobacterales bacterium]|nr:flagellar biosynthesis protein FlhB [Desulfobacterales bacterium]